MHHPGGTQRRHSFPASEAIFSRSGIICSNSINQQNSFEKGRSISNWLIRPQRGWRRITQTITPAWFAMTTATGIISSILHEFSSIYPGHRSSLRILSIIFFVLNVFLFALLSFLTLLKYTLYPKLWASMLRHPVQSLSISTIPMGFATLVNMFTVHCAADWGGASIKIAWALWWIDAITSTACCVGLPFLMMTKHEHRHETMTAAWLLPFGGTIVAAASGGIVGSVLPKPEHSLWTALTGYALWGTGVPLSLGVMVIYFHRLTIHGLPPREVIPTVFLPLGPLGQGGFSIMKLGQVALEVFAETKVVHPLAGEMLYVLGFVIALVFWGAGLVWLFFAFATVGRAKLPFNMGWWGPMFPFGVYAMSTLTIGNELPSPFFKIVGTVFGVVTMLIWIVAATGTVKHMVQGTLFEGHSSRELEKSEGVAVDVD